MPANSRWDLIRGLKGYIIKNCLASYLSKKERFRLNLQDHLSTKSLTRVGIHKEDLLFCAIQTKVLKCR